MAAHRRKNTTSDSRSIRLHWMRRAVWLATGRVNGATAFPEVQACAGSEAVPRSGTALAETVQAKLELSRLRLAPQPQAATPARVCPPLPVASSTCDLPKVPIAELMPRAEAGTRPRYGCRNRDAVGLAITFSCSVSSPFDSISASSHAIGYGRSKTRDSRPMGRHGAQLPSARTSVSWNGPQCRSQPSVRGRTCVGNILIYITISI